MMFFLFLWRFFYIFAVGASITADGCKEVVDLFYALRIMDMKKFLLMLFLVLPCITMAQRQYREYYWVYYAVDSSLFVEREFKYGGYQDYVRRTILTEKRARMDDSSRAAYDKERAEFAKTLVFYTWKEIERNPVRLKQGDWFNKEARAGKHPKGVFLN